MRKILIAFAILILSISNAFALEIKKSATPKLPVVLIDSTDHVTGKTGITSPTVYYVVQDGSAANKTSPTFGELDATNMKGLYQLTLDSTMTGTVGKLVVYVTKTGCDDFRAEVDIVDNLESDTYSKVSPLTYTVANQVDVNVVDWKGATAAAMTGDAYSVVSNGTYGNSALNTAIGTRMATFTLPTNFSALSISATTGLVDITQTAADKVWGTATRALTDKSGFALTQTFPTNFSALSISATTGLVDITQTAADKVWGTTARVLTAGTNIALAKGTGVTGFNDIAATDVWSAGTRTLTANTNFNDLNAAAVATAVWNAATATYGSSGSYGLLLETNLDTNIGSRGTGTSTLTAANVWQTDISGYSTAGQAGTLLKSAGAAGDPWEVDLPGSYTTGQAGSILGAELQKLIKTQR